MFTELLRILSNENGVIRMDGPAEEVLAAYNAFMDGQVNQTQ